MIGDPRLSNPDLDPVSPEQRTWSWWHIAALWIGMAVCIPTYTLASGLVDQGWTWQAAVGAVVLGNVVVVATLTTNVAANVVAPANGFSNFAPSRISFRAGAMITMVIGILIMPWRLYNDAAAYIFSWLIGYGALLGPVAGILIADYFVVRRGRLVVPDLYRRNGAYEYRRGVNWVAMTALALGVFPSLPGFIASLHGTAPSGLFGTICEWAWFVGFDIAAAAHIALMRLFTAGAAPGGEAALAGAGGTHGVG